MPGSSTLRLLSFAPGGYANHAAFAPAALRSADWTISSGLSPSAAESSFSASGGV